MIQTRCGRSVYIVQTADSFLYGKYVHMHSLVYDLVLQYVLSSFNYRRFDWLECHDGLWIALSKPKSRAELLHLRTMDRSRAESRSQQSIRFMAILYFHESKIQVHKK